MTTETTTQAAVPITTTTTETPTVPIVAPVAEEQSVKGTANWPSDWKEKLAAKAAIPVKADSKVVETNATSKDTASTVAVVTPPVAKPEDELSARLADIARQSRIVAKREADLKIKEAKILETTKADTELAS